MNWLTQGLRMYHAIDACSLGDPSLGEKNNTAYENMICALAAEVIRLQKIEVAANEYMNIDIDDPDIDFKSTLAFANLKESLK